MSDETTLKFTRIHPIEFREKMRLLYKWNIQPLTIMEILRTGDAVHCPACKRARYVMGQLAKPQGTLYMDYCTCREGG